MKNKRFPKFISILCLSLILATVPFMTSCAKPVAPPAPTPTAPAPTPTAPAPTPTAPAPAPAPVKPIKLSYTYMVGQLSWGAVHAHQPWAKQVEEATKNRVELVQYPSETLVKGADTWAAVKTGVADIGWCMGAFTPGVAPLTDVITNPGLSWRSAEQSSAVLWQLYEKFPSIQKEFADFKVVLLHTCDPYFLGTSKKQVKTLEDLKGLKIRTITGPPTVMMTKLGAVPLFISTADVYMAIQKGVIDGSLLTGEMALGFRLNEVLKYYVPNVPSFTAWFYVLMNLNTWNRLPPDIQEQIMSNGRLEGSKWFGKNFFDSARIAMVEETKKAGLEMVEYYLPAEEAQRWVAVSSPIQDEWVNKTKAAGYPQAQEIFDTMLNMLKTYAQ